MGHRCPGGCCADRLRNMSLSWNSPRIRGVSLSPRNRPHPCPCHQSFTRDKDASRQQVGKSLSRVPVCRPLRGTRTAPRIRDRVPPTKTHSRRSTGLKSLLCGKGGRQGGVTSLILQATGRRTDVSPALLSDLLGVPWLCAYLRCVGKDFRALFPVPCPCVLPHDEAP